MVEVQRLHTKWGLVVTNYEQQMLLFQLFIE